MEKGGNMDMDKDTDTILYRREQKKTESRLVLDFRETKKILLVSEPFRNEPKQKIGVSKQTETEDYYIHFCVMDIGLDMGMDVAMAIFLLLLFCIVTAEAVCRI
jgi:hypothetical protein